MTARSAKARMLRTPMRQLVAGMDTYRSTGPGYIHRRLREDARLERVGEGRTESVYRTIWASAAEALGAEMVPLSGGFLELRRGSARTRVRLQATMLDDGVSLALALDRVLVHRLLTEAGVPVPEHVAFRADEPARALHLLAGDEGSSWVLKPAKDSGGGQGITTGIRRGRDLERAALRASRHSSHVILERQSPGTTYRLLVLDGVLIDTIRQSPPRVTGDGRSTIRELIVAENLRRLAGRGHARTPILKADLDAQLTLRRAGLSLRSVPGRGQVVQVKTVTNQNCVTDNETVREPVAAEVVAAATRAARVVGLRLAGIDVVTPDLGRPLAEVGGSIVEVNGTPGLDHHYLVADQVNATPVAVAILRKLLFSRPGGRAAFRRGTSPGFGLAGTAAVGIRT